MGRTTFEDIWDEYLELEANEKPQFLYDASITLREQGNETAHRAVLYQAIEDAFEVGDSLTAANATVELSKHLAEVKELTEATVVITGSIERFAPWQSFELGLLFRSLAWSHRALGDNLKHEECLKIAIAQFDSCNQPAWSYPLTNELGEVFLATGDWSSLADLLRMDESQHECVAPIAWKIREYLLGRLALKQLNLELAIRYLLGSAVILEREKHRLLENALQALSWAIQRSEHDAAEVLELYESEFEIEPEESAKLVIQLSRETEMFTWA